MKRKRLAALAACAGVCACALAAAGSAAPAVLPGTVGVEAGVDVGGQVSNAQLSTPDALHQGIYVRHTSSGDGNAATDGFDAAALTGCDATGCGTWDSHASANVDESAGTLKALASNALSIDGAQSGFGGTSYVRSHATVNDTITLSQAATVHIVGSLDGAISSTNETGGEYSDLAPDASVSIGFLERNPLCRECGWRVNGYVNDISDAGTPSDTFDIPVDLPAGDSSFVADLELDAGNILLDGPSVHERQSATVDFAGTVHFRLVVPNDVTVESVSGNLPVVGGMPGGPPADTTAPVTTASAPDGWIRGPVTVSLDAADTGSSVAGITYSATGANAIPETTATGSHVDFPVTAEGATTITYAATDAAGNVEAPKTVTVRVDDTAPGVVASGFDGWSNHPVTVTIHATDTGSGVASVSYRAPGSPSDTTVAGDTATLLVQMPRTSTVTYWATDGAGNVSAPQTLTVRIDADPPRITVPGGVTVDATSPNGAVVTYTATAWDVIDSSPTIDCTPRSGSLFPIGVSHVTCTAQDEAGNTSTATFAVTVRSALEMTSELPTPNFALGALATSAQREIEAGHTRAAIAMLAAYINVVRSPLGQHDLTQAQIDAAAALARQIITVLG